MAECFLKTKEKVYLIFITTFISLFQCDGRILLCKNVKSYS